METKYDELKEKASKGPFEVTDQGGVIYLTGVEFEQGDVCDFYHKTGEGKVFRKANCVANAQLIAHTLNHFPKVLEALERLDAEYKDARAICGMLEMTGARDQAIKEIESARVVQV